MLLHAIVLSCAGAMPFEAAGDDERPDATGTVLDAAGVPVEDATVFVYTAGPKVGTSPY